METARKIARTEGILCGISSGANAWAAMQIAKRPEFKGKEIVGMKYEALFNVPALQSLKSKIS